MDKRISERNYLVTTFLPQSAASRYVKIFLIISLLLVWSDRLKDMVYLVDGTSLCYRAFFAIKLSNSRGFPTGAIYGFFQTIRKIISQYKPVYMGVCFDVSRKTFRQDKFKEYKIQRPPLPDNLSIQFPVIKKLTNLLGITIVEKEGFEADDVIASLIDKITKEDASAVIVSSDKDMHQLLKGERIMIYNPNQEKFIKEEDFVKDYGFLPELSVDYLSLTGDSIDNIPGAKGIGKVGASKLIREFGTVEKIFENIDNISSRMKDILLNNKENIFLSKELVQLYHPELTAGYEDLKIKETNYSELHKLLCEMEFKTFLKEFSCPAMSLNMEIKEGRPPRLSPCLPVCVPVCVRTRTGRRQAGSPIGERSGEGDSYVNKLFFSLNKDCVYIFSEEEKCIYKTKLEDVDDLLCDINIEKISYDFKTQLQSIRDIKICGRFFDVKIAAYLIDSSFADYNLNTLLSYYLGETISDISPEYAPCFIYRLYNHIYPKLKKEEDLEKLFIEVEMPLMDVLIAMEKWGVNVDINILQKLLAELDKRLEELENEIFSLTGKSFNLNSPRQLSEILFKELKIPPVKKTKTGYSTNEEVLRKLSQDHPIVRLILENRELYKLKTTYITPFLEDVREKEGKIHATFNQTSTSTGRLSSSSPNMQSIPVRGRFSSYLRSSFVSGFNNGYILSADYSQIELRLLAYFSQDEKLMDAFINDTDIHRYTASLLFGIDEKEVNNFQRDLAKRINFSIIYGMGPYRLSQELNITLPEAEAFINDYFLRYPKVLDYIQNVYKEVEEKGYVTTILGRRRYLVDFNSRNEGIREFNRRQAVNTPIQGSCADLIKLSMVRIYKEFKDKNIGAKLIMQIHDELVFDVPSTELKETADIANRHMQNCINLNVPLRVNLKVGKNWGEMKEL